MTDFGNLVVFIPVFAVVGFMLGGLWNDISKENKREEINHGN
ncbi:hypothetical protein ACFOZY_03200 [Chungangia koreensis]|uniref:Uncharacterized protein n=1 Tax=Chungangia koreensis TaxID=752657 RepID=A0ABV8X1T0_9LACT